jgi:CHASE2 domain-containing sensor protein
MDLKQIVERRTEQLSFSTRWEILLSIGATLFLVAMMTWRLQVAHEVLLEVGFAAAIAWMAISLYVFRRRIWVRDSPRRDAVAASGREFYRRQLERRRDHLRNEWLWHGPLLLASVLFVAVLMGKTNIAFRSLQRVVPLLALLVAWTGFGIWRRRLQARALQREIDEMAPSGQRLEQK